MSTFVYILFYQSIFPSSNSTYGAWREIFPEGVFWLSVLLSVVTALLPFYVMRLWSAVRHPDTSQLIREMVKTQQPPFDAPHGNGQTTPHSRVTGGTHGGHPTLHAMAEPPSSPSSDTRDSTHHGYAFAHSRGWGRLILRGLGLHRSGGGQRRRSSTHQQHLGDESTAANPLGQLSSHTPATTVEAELKTITMDNLSKATQIEVEEVPINPLVPSIVTAM